MSSSVTIIIPSHCPDLVVKGYEIRCLEAVKEHTPRELYDLVAVQGPDWSFPQKVNAAMTGVRTDYAVVLSNDVFVGPGWLEKLLRDYQSIENCGVLAPMDTGCSHMLETTYDDHWWACVLIEMWKWWKVQPFDESLPLAYHDQDWSIRCKLAGFEICRTGNVVVEHVNMATRSRMPRDGEAAEKAEMERRWGTSEFRDWVRMNADSIPR